MDVAFLINTTSKIADDAFDLMKRTIHKFIVTHGEEQGKYQIIIHGADSTPKGICADDVKGLRRGTVKYPALHANLKEADKSFFKTSEASSEKVRAHQYFHFKISDWQCRQFRKRSSTDYLFNKLKVALVF